MNNQDHHFEPPPRDELDNLLRDWHDSNRTHAAQGRDRLMAALKREDAQDAPSVIEAKPVSSAEHTGVIAVIRRSVASRYAPLAAAAVAIACVLPFMLPGKGTPPAVAQLASNIVMAPEGGLLEARDGDGNPLGPCTLAHTDVKAEISGRFSRVTLKQQYKNPHPDKIEAVYTFPLSHRAGVDRMTMTIGDRVISGEVKEREAARQIYEAAKQANRIASLLEQERPNIFTQSVANIEPGATIDIEISYVELVKETDGQFAFEFPTVVGPRYIPGAEINRSPGKDPAPPLPDGIQRRAGLVLIAPATISNVTSGDGAPLSAAPEGLAARLNQAIPIQPRQVAPDAAPRLSLQADYPDGSAEPAVLYADGTGVIGTRWFYCPPPPTPPTPSPPDASAERTDSTWRETLSSRTPSNDPRSQAYSGPIDNHAPAPGTSFSGATTQVPDAGRITPTPTRPPTRTGQDISISITLDTGGPGITTLDSALHKINRTDLGTRDDGLARRTSITLANAGEIPNRDFVLTWKQTSDTITDAVFTNTGPHGNFFCIQLDPPARVTDAQAVPRELIFVLDTSGSMSGLPIAKSREIMQKAIDAMRSQDTFNLMTFAGDTKILWPEPRSSTPENRQIAQKFITTLEGGGGTEMMKAINAALVQSPERVAGEAGVRPILPAELADLPADGRQVTVRVEDHQLSCPRGETSRPGRAVRCGLAVRSDLVLDLTDFSLPDGYGERVSTRQTTGSVVLNLRGRWLTRNGVRTLDVAAATYAGPISVRPLRLAMFLTDGYVGNDMAIIDAIRKNRATTRVFAFGIGNSVNRYLLDNMAAAGGGEAEYVLIDSQDTGATEANASQAVERFNRRTATPVLTDIRVTFSDGLKPVDMLPDPSVGGIPDLFDNRPLTIIGRYNAYGAGTITITGQTASGAWEKSILATFPAADERNTSLPTVWARTKIESLMNQDLTGIQTQQVNPDIRNQIITLGETFGVMSQFTSFVAVDKLRVTIAGRPRLVNIPIELPDSTRWEGFFGGEQKQEAHEPLGRDDAEAPQEKITLPTSVLDTLVQVNLEVQSRRGAQMGSVGDSSSDEDGLASTVFAGVADAVAAPSNSAPPATGSGAPTPAPAASAPTASAPSITANPAPVSTPPPPGAPAASTEAAPTTPARSSAPGANSRSVAPDAGDRKDQAAAGAPAAAPTMKSGSPPPPPPPSPSPHPTSAQPSASTAAKPADPGASNKHAESESTARFYGSSGVKRKTDEAPQLREQNTRQADSILFFPSSSPTTSTMGVPVRENVAGGRSLGKAESLARAPTGHDFACNSMDAIRLEGGVISDRYAFIHSGAVPPPAVNVLAATQLAQNARLAEARNIVCDTPNDTNYQPWSELCKVLTVVRDEKTLPKPQAEQVLAIQRQAQGDLLAERRRAKLERTLDPTLQALSSDAKATREKTATRATDSDLVWVTLLLADLDKATLERLRALGITIESTNTQAKVVVARVPRSRITEAALLSGVLRMEALPEEP